MGWNLLAGLGLGELEVGYHVEYLRDPLGPFDQLDQHTAGQRARGDPAHLRPTAQDIDKPAPEIWITIKIPHRHTHASGACTRVEHPRGTRPVLATGGISARRAAAAGRGQLCGPRSAAFQAPQNRARIKPLLIELDQHVPRTHACAGTPDPAHTREPRLDSISTQLANRRDVNPHASRETVNDPRSPWRSHSLRRKV